MADRRIPSVCWRLLPQHQQQHQQVNENFYKGTRTKRTDVTDISVHTCSQYRYPYWGYDLLMEALKSYANNNPSPEIARHVLSIVSVKLKPPV